MWPLRHEPVALKSSRAVPVPSAFCTTGPWTVNPNPVTTPSSWRTVAFRRTHAAETRNAGPFEARSIAVRPMAAEAPRAIAAAATSGIQGRARR